MQMYRFAGSPFAFKVCPFEAHARKGQTERHTCGHCEPSRANCGMVHAQERGERSDGGWMVNDG